MNRDKIENTPEAIELRGLLCASCYRSLVDWISGRVTDDAGNAVRPFTPCDRCAPAAQAWLERRSRG